MIKIKGKRITYEEIKEYLLRENYLLITQKNNFISTNYPLKIKCSICGYEDEVKYRDFKKRAIKCKKCYGNAKLRELTKILNNKNYTLLTSEFISTKSNLDIICDKGHIWNPSYDSVIKGCNCLTCRNIEEAKKQRISKYELEKRFNIEGYKLLSDYDEYENNKTLLKVSCPKGHIYYASLSNWTKGRRCPRCKESKGELIINDYLFDKDIKFERQKKFNNCIYKKELRFDFYLEELNVAIEYDGEQHFHRERFGMSEEEFRELKIRDNIKTQFCIDNDIKLIRIPYYEFDNINNILNETFRINFND